MRKTLPLINSLESGMLLALTGMVLMMLTMMTRNGTIRQPIRNNLIGSGDDVYIIFLMLPSAAATSLIRDSNCSRLS